MAKPLVKVWFSIIESTRAIMGTNNIPPILFTVVTYREKQWNLRLFLRAWSIKEMTIPFGGDKNFKWTTNKTSKNTIYTKVHVEYLPCLCTFAVAEAIVTPFRSSHTYIGKKLNIYLQRAHSHWIDLSTARPKWRLDGPALSGHLLYSLVNHAYANRYPYFQRKVDCPWFKMSCDCNDRLMFDETIRQLSALS